MKNRYIFVIIRKSYNHWLSVNRKEHFMKIKKVIYRFLLLALICFQSDLLPSIALSDQKVELKRNRQGEVIGLYFDGHFAGLIGQTIVKKYGGEPLEKSIIYNGGNTTKGFEVTYYDLEGNLLQSTIVFFDSDKDQITLSDGTELRRNKDGERIGLYFNGEGHLVRFVAQTPNPKLKRSIDYLFISEWEPR
jgi:hypothetical protein